MEQMHLVKCRPLMQDSDHREIKKKKSESEISQLVYPLIWSIYQVTKRFEFLKCITRDNPRPTGQS